MRAIPLVLAVALLSPALAFAQAGSSRSLISAGAQHAAAGAATLSSNLGDVLSGRSAADATTAWHGFHAPAMSGVVGAPGPAAAARTFLARPSPSPTRQATRVTYALAATDRDVDLAIYDVGGRRVRQLVSGAQAPGVHSLAWDLRSQHGARVASGHYFIRLRTASQASVARFVIVP